jgi:UDP-glucose 4-epimerase
VPAVDKARDLLGFEAKVDLDDGILRSAEYYRRQIGVRAPQAAVLAEAIPAR